ncbi:related to FK506 suppressor Sfk1 [Rhynchosporium agropyri]|uniref:Related to FK506 suppressor Sfk1 n=2 Tax=Rhynchosporium TaxID=38037 RepID=A0A1E1MGA0_RHYSE|nr:related to FK506 suppressor Sfk1 [Rhynchosporium agropyri]CZT47735.1 related to FK506 suppressor Sfk1 [Rhynchosporium secalis]
MTGVKAPWWATIYVLVPIFSGFVWLGMLLGMLLWWIVKEDSVHLFNMSAGQDIAYISDIGALDLQPLFIAMGTVTVVSFTSVFVTERWLRHRGTIARNTSRWQKTLSSLAIIFAVIGMIGLIILTCKNNVDYSTTHNVCLVIFIAGYIISAIFVCWEYQRLGIHYRQYRILAISFWIKLAFIFVEFSLAIAFGVLGHQKKYNSAAVVEWVISLIYTFYVWSYVIDFIPAIRTRHYASKETEIDMVEGMEREARMRGYPGGVAEEQSAYGSTRPIRGHESRNF